MSFIVEDGTGVADANSYATVEYADSYFKDRNITSWSGSATIKQALLIRATDYINTRFDGRFKGEQVYTEEPAQVMAFPRTEFTPNMPVNLLKATCEYALRAKVADLAPDLKTGAGGHSIVSEKSKVGPLEKETHYDTQKQASVIKSYPAADMLIKPLLKPKGAGVIRG